MRMTALIGACLKAASALQDMAAYMRPRASVILFSVSAAIIMFVARYIPKDAGD